MSGISSRRPWIRSPVAVSSLPGHRLVVRKPRGQQWPISAAQTGYEALENALDEYRNAPPSIKSEFTGDIMEACEELKTANVLKKWGIEKEELPSRRQVSLGDLRMIGVKQPEAIAQLSVRNDAAFLFSVVSSTSIIATILGATLPGDWGFFSSYLTGGIAIVVLAIGSTNPGILQFAIDSFSKVFPDYRKRVVIHEAAHFLLAHLLGVPVVGYSLMLGKEHTDLAEAALQRRLIEKQLDEQEVNRLGIIAMAGATAEAMNFPEVMGQNADMLDLQRIMMRSSTKLGNQQQQNLTRWASYQAASLLRKYKAEYEALVQCMESAGSVKDCIVAIENATPSA